MAKRKRRKDKNFPGRRTKRRWKDMMRRCHNPNTLIYADYGAKGILVHPRWHSYANFKSDMGICPVDGSLDRIDNSRGYEPGNCRWVSNQAQQHNKTNIRLYSAFGLKLTIREFVRIIGRHESTVHNMAKRKGLDKQQVVDYYAKMWIDAER